MLGNRVSRITSETDDNAKYWFSEIDRGIKYRKEHLESYKRNAAFENMSQWSDGATGYRRGDGDEVTVNKFGAYIRTRRAVLGYNNPRAKCTPKSSDGYEEIQVPLIGEDGTPKMDEMGQVMTRPIQKFKAREELINSIISSPMFGLTDTMTRLIRAGDIGYGALKTGYRAVFSTPPKEEGEQSIPLKDGEMDLTGFARNNVDGKLVEAEGGDELVSREKIPVWEDWFIDWVSYERIIVDPDCENDTNQLRWIVEEEIRPLSDVKEDPLYDNTKELQGTGEDTLDNKRDNKPTLYDDSKIKEKHKRVRLFHIWDRVNDKYMVLADGHGKWLRDEKTPRGVYEDPYSFYRNNETLGNWYQRANGTDLVPIAMQYNIASQMLMRAMNSTRKVFMDSRVFDSVNKDIFQSSEDMAIVTFDRTALSNTPFNDAVIPYSPPPVPAVLYQNLARIEKDFYEVAGLPPEAVGAPKSETATQANIMNQYHGTRIETDRMCLGGCLKIIFKKLDDSLDANMTQPRAVNIQGTDGQAFTALIDHEMIVGDFDIDIDVEDMAPKNSGMESAQWIQASQVVGVSPWLVSDEILARTYCEKFGIKDDKYVQAIAQAAQANIAMQQQAMMPEAPPPTNEADAISQTAAGGQVPRMSSAT